MTRALTLVDLFNQLNNDSASYIDLAQLSVINEYMPDVESSVVTDTSVAVSHGQLLVPYDVQITKGGAPASYWRMNENLNILTVADQSFESGVGTWTATSSTIAQSNFEAKDGSYSLKITANSVFSGAKTGEYQIIPGVAYAGSFWVYSTVASLNFEMSLNWLDASGSLITSQVSTSAVGTLNTWTQFVFSGNAPSNAFYLTVQPYCTNSANTNVWYLDVVTVMQIGYDSNAYVLQIPGYIKANASTVASGTKILPGQSGPYTYPGGGFLPGSALFTTTVDAVSIPNTLQLQIINDLTIEAWINPTIALSGSSGNSYGVIAKTNDTSEYALYIRGDGSVVFSHSTNTGVVVANAGSLSATNNWSHVVVTRDSSALKITGYVNGAVQNSISYTTAPATTTNPVVIGASSSHATVAGLKIAEVAVYGVSLPAGQILNHYNYAGYGSLPSGQVTTGSGYGFQYTATGGNAPAKYGQYGFQIYPGS